MRRFQSLMGDVELCLFFDPDPAIFYFTGLRIEHSVLGVPKEGEPFIIVAPLEEARARSKVHDVRLAASHDERARVILHEFASRRVVGVNKRGLFVSQLDFLKSVNPYVVFADVSDLLVEVRQVKSSEEVGLLRNSCKVADRIISKCVSSFDFTTELEVRNFLDFEAKKSGFDVAFPTIVASGKNAALPHYDGSSRLQSGFCVIDFGVRFEGYCSDITRTIYIGRPSPKELELYRLVCGAQQRAISRIRNGVEAGLVDLAARDFLGEHKGAFIHSLGHHLGVEVHDPGFRIGPGSKGVLLSGMVVTVEPGIYYSGRFGIRVEDDVLVTLDGCEALTSSSRDLVCIEKL